MSFEPGPPNTTAARMDALMAALSPRSFPRTIEAYEAGIDAMRLEMWLRLQATRHPDNPAEVNVWGLLLDASLEYRRLLLNPPRGRGRPKGNGRFRDAEDFHKAVVGDLRQSLNNGLKDIQQELASLWDDVDPGVDVDSLVSEIKRYC